MSSSEPNRPTIVHSPILRTSTSTTTSWRRMTADALLECWVVTGRSPTRLWPNQSGSLTARGKALALSMRRRRSRRLRRAKPSCEIAVSTTRSAPQAAREPGEAILTDAARVPVSRGRDAQVRQTVAIVGSLTIAAPSSGLVLVGCPARSDLRLASRAENARTPPDQAPNRSLMTRSTECHNTGVITIDARNIDQIDAVTSPGAAASQRSMTRNRKITSAPGCFPEPAADCGCRQNGHFRLTGI